MEETKETKETKEIETHFSLIHSFTHPLTHSPVRKVYSKSRELSKSRAKQRHGDMIYPQSPFCPLFFTPNFISCFGVLAYQLACQLACQFVCSRKAAGEEDPDTDTDTQAEEYT
jgi:hypothetical protein